MNMMNQTYQKVSAGIIERLVDICGKRNVYTGEEKMEAYSHDEVAESKYFRMPGVVTNTINDVLKEDGLWFAGYPMSLETCFIGGNVADNKTTIERIWNIRRNIAEAFKVKSSHQSLEDIVVPTAAIPSFMDELQLLIKKYDIPVPCCGHAGDGNLHATVVKPGGMSPSDWEEKLPLLLEDIYKITASLGWVISGEHGIGSKRKNFIGINLSPDEIALMKRLKKAFDPNWILNPGKIFPDED